VGRLRRRFRNLLHCGLTRALGWFGTSCDLSASLTSFIRVAAVALLVCVSRYF
jgi:hypothetical protein